MKKSKENRCQCCNETVATKNHLVFGDEGKRQNIAAVLFDYIGKSLNEQDGIKYGICDPCWQQLIQYSEFREKCIRANKLSNNDDDDNIDDAKLEDEVDDDENNEDDDYDDDDDQMEEETSEQNESLPNEDRYEDSEYLEDSQNESDYDMKVEYLEENDSFDDEIVGQPNIEIERKKIFDLASILVKPIFLLEIDNPEDVIRIKQKISFGIPRHSLKMKNSCRKMNRQNLDVEKIATSNDLIDILEDDYHNETAYAQKAHDTDSEVEYLYDAHPIDINEYLKSIASITYEESYGYESYVNCVLCSEVIISQQHLVYHINESHSLADGFLCVFGENCQPFDDLVKVQEHIFHEHVDSIPTQLCLTCPTCENTFKSSVQFGKHMCVTIEDDSIDFQCTNCDKKLRSKKRYLFHTQFHLENARPKVCIICELSFDSEETFYNHVMFSHERVYEYFCSECDKSFSSNFRLDLHIRTHHTKRTVQCSACDKTFVDKNMLDEHISSKHSARAQTEKLLQCSVCKKVYNRSSRLRKHMTTHERQQKNSVLVCEPCSMAFAGIEDIDEHCNRLHEDDNVNIIRKDIFYVVCCEYCEFAFVDNQKLVQHKETHQNDEKPFKCGFCMACYESYSKLKTHKNTHISQQVKFPVQRHYMCDVNNCWKRYRHWSDLQNHRKTVHLINPSIYKCNDCQQTFYQSWNFNYHKKTVHSVATIKCTFETCKFECKTIYNLKSHQKRMHSTKSVKKLQHPKPKPKSEIRSKNEDVDKHYRKSDTSLVCNLCGKQLSTRHSARSHIKMIHFKIKNFTCENCGKEFYLKKDFNDHKRLHTAETPYECAVCGKKFRTASMVNDHRRSHSNNRPYSCPYCASTFKRAYVLKNHVKQHLGVKGFPCTVDNCKKEYRTKWELNSHQRLKHSNPDSLDEHNNQMQLFTGNETIPNQYADEKKPKTILNKRNNSVIKTEKISPKPKKRKNNQQIIYVMPGPIENDTMEKSSIEHFLEEQTTVSNEADHNYLASENVTNSNVIYVIDPHITSNLNVQAMESNIQDGKPTTILVCNPNFSNMTIMDVGAIQTVDQNAHNT